MKIGLKKSYIAGWLLAAAPLLNSTAFAQSTVGSFEEFRAGLKKNYSDFRTGVLADYDKFLEGVWQDFEVFKGAERSSKPKPKVEPVVIPDNTPDIIPVVIPTPTVNPEPDAPAIPTKPAQPSPVKPLPLTDDYAFDFYGIQTLGPKPEIKLLNVTGKNDFAEQWRQLSQSAKAAHTIKALSSIAGSYGLNDYLTYELVNSYIRNAYQNATQQAQHALAHFILTNLGYDVRLAMGEGGKAMLLIALKSKIYARPFLELNGKERQTYYVFQLEQPDGAKIPASMISTCSLPENIENGKPLNLLINGLTLPKNPKEFTLEGAGMTVSGEYNANIAKVLYRYPQMEMGGYAASVVLPAVRNAIVQQLKAQLDTLNGRKAVDKLLQFCQQITAYATDGANHGFEKPYFMEEMLVYPKSDCEDRAIMYTYLLKNVLGLENQLIAYPGHESASVQLNDGLPGDSYEYNGKKFYISDPTFIGSKTGMCMPEYKTVKPGIDYHYKP